MVPQYGCGVIDGCLYHPLFHCVPLNRLQHCNVHMVSELIDDARWKLKVLGSSISIEERDAIRSISLSIRRTNDRLIWHYDC